METSHIGIIGAGISGLACARILVDHGLSVTVFDKGRGPGGRISTRRTEDATYDHGAMFMDGPDALFQRQLQRWASEGAVAQWQVRCAAVSQSGELKATGEQTRWVGTPTMSAVARAMARGIEVIAPFRVFKTSRDAAGWWCSDADGVRYGPYAHLVVSVPAPQAVPLVSSSTALVDVATSIHFAPCLVAMCRYGAPIPVPFEMLTFEDPVLALAVRDGHKPGRDAAGDAWVVHATAAWSDPHMLDSFADIGANLEACFRERLGGAFPAAEHHVGHCWRYSQVTRPAGAPFATDPRVEMSMCGDGLLGPEASHALSSGTALGDHLAQKFGGAVSAAAD